MENNIDIEVPPTAGPRPSINYFSGQMPVVSLPVGYQIGLILVAGAMILLPLLYLGFTATLAWGTWRWATSGFNLLFPSIGGTRHIYWFLLVLYVTPLFVGCALVFFMLKCFVSRWQRVQFACPLSHPDHPEIIRFLGQLCQQMRVPIPSRVDVVLGIGAFVGFREGLGSLFGNDIKLTFGLPLVAAMTCQELAAVLAHELGHFTQRWAMRCDFLIRTVQGWLFRGVFEQDDFDNGLRESAGQSAFGVVLFICASVGIAFTRAIMWLLLMLSHALTSFLSRQMEFHADACAIAVAGTDGFVPMLNKLHILQACAEQARGQIRHQVVPKYPDDLSTYLAMLASNCSGQAQGRLLDAAGKARTRWYESHPAHAERIRRALLADENGTIHDSRPATALFNGFSDFSRSLTLASYQLPRRGKPITPSQIFRVEPPPDQTAPDTSAEEDTLRRYFGGLGSFLDPILLDPESRLTVGLGSAKVEHLLRAKTILHDAALAPLLEAHAQLDARLLQALEAASLAQVGCELSPEAFPLLECEDCDISPLVHSLHAQEKRIRSDLAPFQTAARSRLMTTLSLLRTPSVAARLPNTQSLHEEVLDLLHVLGKLSAAFPTLLDLRRRFVGLNTLLQVRQRQPSPSAEAALHDSASQCNELLSQIHQGFGTVGYPFAHVKGHLTLTEYARAKRYDTDTARMTCLEVQSHLQMLVACYHRILARLVAIANLVEGQLT